MTVQKVQAMPAWFHAAVQLQLLLRLKCCMHCYYQRGRVRVLASLFCFALEGLSQCLLLLCATGMYGIRPVVDSSWFKHGVCHLGIIMMPSQAGLQAGLRIVSV
jgi:hypothetical protein